MPKEDITEHAVEAKSPSESSPVSTLRQNAEFHLVGQIHHTQVRLYFEAEGWEAGHAVLWPGELMEDDGVFRVQLLLLPAQIKKKKKTVLFDLVGLSYKPKTQQWYCLIQMEKCGCLLLNSRSAGGVT